MIRVLFVCLGNICRSPMAEAVFYDLVKQAGLDEKIMVDSAGTSGWHEGEAAHSGTLDVLRRNGIQYNGRSRMIVRADLDDYDYIVVMDRSNFDNVNRLVDRPHPKVTMFLSYANRDGATRVTDVPDPYYTGTFDEVYMLVKTGARSLLAHIRQEQGV